MKAGDKVLITVGDSSIPEGERGCLRELEGEFIRKTNAVCAYVELTKDDLLSFTNAPAGGVYEVHIRRIKLKEPVEEW